MAGQYLLPYLSLETPLPQADQENLEMQTVRCGRKGGREGPCGWTRNSGDQEGACAETWSVSAQRQVRLHAPPKHAQECTGVVATLLQLLIYLLSLEIGNSHSQIKTKRMFQSLAKAPSLPLATCT